MLAAVLLIAMYPDWVPARWPSADVKSLELLANTPINCLWLERPQWSAGFAAEAAKRGIATLGVIRREGDPIEAARALAKTGMTGGVLEGNFDEYSLTILTATLAKAKMMYLEAGPRSRVRFDSGAPILATSQGLWPGIHVEKGSDASAGPTANPWIDTNTGFLRYARASTEAAVWMAVRPPEKTVYPVTRYLQAIGDAAMNGARWVVALDSDLERRLLAREPKALKDWGQIGAALRHFEEHREWRAAAPAGHIAIVQDDGQARLSGGLFDMLASKHMPVFAVPRERLAGLSRKEKLVFEAPPVTGQSTGQSEEAFVYDPKDTSVNTVWQKVAGEVGRRNMGARLFNVSSMLSHVVELKGQKQLVLHLVNYSDYPASGITARVLGVYSRARLFRPGEAPVDLETEKVEDGTGFAIDQRITTIATVVLE
jgi:hypothetical protein